MNQRICASTLFLAVIISFLSLVSLTKSASADPLMQCMTDCVKQEGNTAAAKLTCKSRCAPVTVPELNSTAHPPSCMTIYKKCNRTCDKTDKACLRPCKEALMECR